MQVSVILPNYNHAAFLQQRIDSILNQSFTDFELIILDDCSTDSSRDIIEQYRGHPQITTIVYNEANSGSTFKQWKKGIELARGKYVWFAESDDYSDWDFLAKLVPLFDTTANVGLVFCNSHVVDATAIILGHSKSWGSYFEANRIPGVVTVLHGYKFCLDYLFLLNRIPNASAVLFRREIVVQHLDWIDTSLRNSGDWKLWINIALKTNFVWLNSELNYFRIHGKNVTNSFVLLKTEALSILKEFNTDKKVTYHNKLHQYIYFWSFNTASWPIKFSYNKNNFQYYFKNNTSMISVCYLGYVLLKRSVVFVIGLLKKISFPL